MSTEQPYPSALRYYAVGRRSGREYRDGELYLGHWLTFTGFCGFEFDNEEDRRANERGDTSVHYIFWGFWGQDWDDVCNWVREAA